MLLNSIYKNIFYKINRNMTKPLNYLDINSSYRNRKLWPQIGEFDVITSQSGSRDKLNAFDPVCNSAPQKVWNSSFWYRYDTGDVSQITDISIVATVAGPPDFSSQTDPTFLEISVQNGGGGQIFRPEENFYDGAVLVFGTVRRRIILYKFISTDSVQDIALIRVSSAFPDTVMTLSNGVIGDPSYGFYSSLYNNFNKPQIFIPYSEDIDNYFINSTITDMYTGENRTVIEYSAITHLATINLAFSYTYGTPHTFNWVLRTSPALLSGSLIAGSGYVGGPYPETILNQYNGKYLALPVSASTMNNFYNGDFLRIANGRVYPTIQNITNSGVQPTSPVGTMTRIKNHIGLKTVTKNTVPNSATPVDVIFDGILVSTENEYYTNSFVRFPNSTKPTTVYRVISYNGLTKTATIEKNSGSIVNIGDSVEISSIELDIPIDSCSNYVPEILQFTRDNFTPLFNFNSVTSSSQDVCYEVNLLNILLPNIVLNVGRGGRAVFYPHVYVELIPLSSQYKNAIYSNNPYTNKALFKVIVSDMTNQTVSPFVRLKTDGMCQTIKFKPNTDFRFRVLVPDGGQTFSVSAPEFYSPMAPNPLMQITATFSIKRIV